MALSSIVINQLEKFQNNKIWVVTMLKFSFDVWALKSSDSQIKTAKYGYRFFMYKNYMYTQIF